MSIKRNASYNLLGAIVPIGISLFTVPAYLSAIGEARFGILALTWLLLGYFGIFDLGLGMATSHHIAAADADAAEERAQLFWTALAANLLLGLVGGLIIWPVAYFYFDHIIVVEPAMRTEMLASVPWLVLAVPVATTSGVLIGALQGLHRFGQINLISAGGTILFQVLPLAAARFWSPSLGVVLPVALAARALTLPVLYAVVSRAIVRNHRFAFSWDRAMILLKFGGWITITTFFVPFLGIADRFTIGGVFGAASVAYYTVPANLGDRLTVLGNSLGSALFPRLSSLDGKDLLSLSIRSERALLAAMLPIGVGAIFAIEPFLRLWTGSSFAANAAEAGKVLMIGMFFDAISRIPLYTLRGQTRPEAVAKVELIQLFFYWPLLYFALVRFGIAGAAWAVAARTSANYFLLAREAGSLNQTVSPVLVSAALLLTSWLGAEMFAPSGPAYFACGALALLSACAVSLLISLKALRRWFRRHLAVAAALR